MEPLDIFLGVMACAIVPSIVQNLIIPSLSLVQHKLGKTPQFYLKGFFRVKLSWKQSGRLLQLNLVIVHLLVEACSWR